MTHVSKNFASLRHQFKNQMVISPNQHGDETVKVGDLEVVEDYLVVLVDAGLNQVFMINLDTKARFPVCVPYFELMEKIDDEEVEILHFVLDPRILMDEDTIPTSFKNKAERRYKDIISLITDLDAVIRNSRGDQLFADTAKAAGKGRDYIYNTFYSFLRNGCRKWGLGLPQGKDANREIKPRKYTVKMGRPPAIPQGKLPDERDIGAFEWAENQYKKKDGPSLKKVVDLMHKKFYYKSKSRLSAYDRRQTGELHEVKLLPADEMPTEEQFKHWLKIKHGGSLPNRDKSRKNATEYAANKVGRKGDAFLHVTAPGQMYTLDETPFDEEVVSIFDETRSTKLGKATLYFVRDTWSWAISGLYITTENPSYATAKEALFNSIRNKANFLKEIGSPIDPKDWPIEGAPQSLLVDNAEFNNTLSEGAVSDLPITIKFARAGRGDDKGLIESMFHAFSSFFKGMSKAHQTKSLLDINKQIARKNACLTINELYIIATVYIRHYNNQRLSGDYPLNQVMVRDGVPPIPNKCLTWGLRYRPGGFTELTEEEVYLRLFEKGEVSVRQDCIYLKGIQLRYNCNWTFAESIQDKHDKKTYPTFPCRYFRGLLDVIYICTPDGLKLATLDNRDRRFSNLSVNEIYAQRAAENSAYEPYRIEEKNSIATMQQFLEDYLSYAKSHKVNASMPDIATIKQNREVESIFDRIQQMNRMAKAVQSQMVFPDSEFPELLPLTNTTNQDCVEHVYDLIDEGCGSDEDDDFYMGIS
tara:strand:- start:11003 stop:13273 length:2271 start_codon:yes stop_codon:yes gene_type:complete